MGLVPVIMIVMVPNLLENICNLMSCVNRFRFSDARADPALEFSALAKRSASAKTTPCQILTYTGISRDNPTCDLSRDIPV